MDVIREDSGSLDSLQRIRDLMPYVQSALNKLVVEGKGDSYEARHLKSILRRSTCVRGKVWRDTNGLTWSDTVYANRTESVTMSELEGRRFRTMTVEYYPGGLPRSLSVLEERDYVVRLSRTDDGVVVDEMLSSTGKSRSKVECIPVRATPS
jgi:hypothetical protein